MYVVENRNIFEKEWKIRNVIEKKGKCRGNRDNTKKKTAENEKKQNT